MLGCTPEWGQKSAIRAEKRILVGREHYQGKEITDLQGHCISELKTMHENGQAALQGGLATKSRRKEGRDLTRRGIGWSGIWIEVGS